MECYKKEQIATNKIIYYLYHIPGKKIGVTRNLIDRVIKQQGYKSDEFEVLDQSEDIDYISNREIELQQSYGYKVDRKKYKNLFNKMKINATEQTSTFPYPLNKLKGNLMDSLGDKWETKFGTFELNKETVKWITENAVPSMYNTKRSFIYNKAFFEEFVNTYEKASKDVSKFSAKLIERNQELIEAMKAELVSKSNAVKSNSFIKTVDKDRFQLIRDWAEERNLYKKGDKKTQFCKLMEEAGELGRAVLKDDQTEFEDAIGDMVVVLTNLAHLGGTSIEDCIDSAYDVISKRTGKMVNGTFVKDK
jgi:NTP pyrophosphatase (non-canonical NTP hydrolase)